MMLRCDYVALSPCSSHRHGQHSRYILPREAYDSWCVKSFRFHKRVDDETFVAKFSFFPKIDLISTQIEQLFRGSDLFCNS